MMKLYARMTDLNAHDVSAKTLKRLRIISLISLPFVPALGLMGSDFVSSPLSEPLPAIILAIITIVSAIALLILCLNKLVNRVWVRDKYLDEWEVQLKYRSMAFGFQVVLYVISAALFLGAALDYFDKLVLPEFTPEVIGYALFSLLMLGLYAQIYAQFAMVQPIEEDEMDPLSGTRKPLIGIFKTTAMILGVCVVIPFALGVISGIKEVRSSDIATLSKKAVSVCTERGSSVHWVSIAEDNYGFACFDENRPAPGNLDSGEGE